MSVVSFTPAPQAARRADMLRAQISAAAARAT